MKRFAVPMLLGALAISAGASRAEAQNFFIGGGPTMPMGDFNDYAKMGYILTAGLGVDIGKKGMFAEAEFWYGSNKHEFAGDKTNIMAGFGALGYSFMPAKKVSPYILGGAGFLSHRFRSESVPADNENESKFAYTGAFGLIFKLSPKASFWVEGRYIGSEFTKLVPLTAGFSINLKSN